MEWVQENWFFILFAVLFIGMHLFGFGCGGHGKHGKHGGEKGHGEHEHSNRESSKEKGESSCH